MNFLEKHCQAMKYNTSLMECFTFPFFQTIAAIPQKNGTTDARTTKKIHFGEKIDKHGMDFVLTNFAEEGGIDLTLLLKLPRDSNRFSLRMAFSWYDTQSMKCGM